MRTTKLIEIAIAALIGIYFGCMLTAIGYSPTDWRWWAVQIFGFILIIAFAEIILLNNR